jgi:hypothetical protein
MMITSCIILSILPIYSFTKTCSEFVPGQDPFAQIAKYSLTMGIVFAIMAVIMLISLGFLHY